MGPIMKIFGGGDSGIVQAPPPVLAPVTPMPIPNDAAVKKANKRMIAGRAAASGRASTILSQNADDDLLGA